MKKLIPVLILSSILLTSCRNTASKDDNTSANSWTTNNNVRDNSVTSNSWEITTLSWKEDVVVDKILTWSKNPWPNELTDKKNTIQKDVKNSSTWTTASWLVQDFTWTTVEEDETLKEIDKIMNEAMNEK